MQEIKQLLAITKQLRDNPFHQGRKFSYQQQNGFKTTNKHFLNLKNAYSF